MARDLVRGSRAALQTPGVYMGPLGVTHQLLPSSPSHPCNLGRLSSLLLESLTFLPQPVREAWAPQLLDHRMRRAQGHLRLIPLGCGLLAGGSPSHLPTSAQPSAQDSIGTTSGLLPAGVAERKQPSHLDWGAGEVRGVH